MMARMHTTDDKHVTVVALSKDKERIEERSTATLTAGAWQNSPTATPASSTRPPKTQKIFTKRLKN